MMEKRHIVQGTRLICTSMMTLFFRRKNHQRTLDGLQISLESEAKSKMEAIRQRKKMEQDVSELEAALEATSRTRGDFEKNNKKFNQQLRDLELLVEEERQATQDAEGRASGCRKEGIGAFGPGPGDERPAGGVRTDPQIDGYWKSGDGGEDCRAHADEFPTDG